MNVNFIRLKGLMRILQGIEAQLTRMADCWELELAEQGVRVRESKVVDKGPEPELKYTDEEEDFVREYMEKMDREKGKVVENDVPD